MVKLRGYFQGIGLVTMVGISGLVAQSTPDANPSINLSSLVKDLAHMSNQDTKRILDQVQATVQQLETSLEQNAAHIRSVTEQKADVLKEEAEKQSKKIFQDYASRANQMQEQADLEITNLKRHAAQKVLQLVARAEEDALKAKQKAREEMLKDLKDTTAPSQAWKETLVQSFSKDIALLKDIILQGETPQQADDFAKRLDQQMNWFDTTLASTHAPTDASYYVLHQKQQALDHLVTAQQQAEKILNRVQDDTKDLNFKRLRLMALYDINDALQKKSADGVAAVAATELSNEEIAQIVSQLIERAKTPQPTAPMVQAKATQPTQHVEEPKHTQEPLLTQEQNTFQQAKMIAQAEESIKRLFIPKLEALSKENLNLQTILMDTQQKMTQLNDKVTQSEHKLKVALDQEHALRMQAQARMSLVEELGDRRYDELLTYLDTKKTFLHEPMTPPSTPFDVSIIQQENDNRQKLDQELNVRIEDEKIK
jgi:hypothetical protein